MRRYFLLALVIACPALARWASREDAPAISKSDKVEIQVEKDGTWKARRNAVFYINNEEGRVTFGTGILKYNSRASQIEDIEAETRNQNEKITVDRDYIEDKPMASSAEGFDESRQVSIAYPKVEVGSELLLRYRISTKEIPIPGVFSEEFVFGDDLLEEATDITIRSPFPLYTAKQDPNHSIEISQTTSGNETVTRIIQKKPIYSRVADELEPKVGRRITTWAVVSSIKEWPALADPLIAAYEEVVGASLPPLFEQIAKEAASKKSVDDKIDTVTTRLAEAVRYLGDWRAVRGGHVPRPLSSVVSTRFGDCKDFSAATVAILRKLGMTAYVAWVERGPQPNPLPPLPVESAFNHAIVWAHDGKQARWIDPTNLVSFSRGTFEDLLGRSAVVLNAKGAKLEMIPEGTSADSKSRRTFNVRFNKNGDADIRASVGYLGRSATAVTGIERQVSKETINHVIAKGIADDHYVLESKIEPYDLTSRVVKDTTLSAKVKVKGYSLRTTAGSAFILPRGGIGKLIDMETAPRVSDFFLGFPMNDQIRYRMEKVTLVGALPKGCRLTSPWLDFRRDYRKVALATEVVDEMSIKKSFIPIEAIHAKEFARLQRDLEACIHKVALVFKE